MLGILKKHITRKGWSIKRSRWVFILASLGFAVLFIKSFNVKTGYWIEHLQRVEAIIADQLYSVEHLLPVGFLCGSSLFYIPILMAREKIQRNKLFRLLFSIRSIIAVLFNLQYVTENGTGSPLTPFSNLLLTSICCIEHRKGQHPSFIPSLYHFFLLSCKLPFLRAVVLDNRHSLVQLSNLGMPQIWTFIHILVFAWFIAIDVLIPTRWFSIENLWLPSSKVIPLFGTNILSRATFTWMIPQLQLSQSRWLTLDDLFTYLPTEGCKYMVNNVYTWLRKRHEGVFSWSHHMSEEILLVLAVLKPFLSTLAASTLLRSFGVLLHASNIFTLRKIIIYFEEGDLDMAWGVALSTRFLLANLGFMLFQSYHLSITHYISSKCKGVCSALVMDKFLKLSAASRRSVNTEIITYMTVDVQRISMIISECNVGFETLVYGPAMVYISWESFGTSTLFGVVTIAVIISINGFFLRGKLNNIKTEELEAKTIRLNIIENILIGLKTLKLNRWEKYFERKVSNVRNTEQSLILKSSYMLTCMCTLAVMAPYLVTSSILISHFLVSEEKVMSAEKLFVAILAADGFCSWALFIPAIVIYFVQGKVSTQRLLKFLLTPVHQRFPGDDMKETRDGCPFSKAFDISFRDQTSPINSIPINEGPNPVVIENLSCSWDETRETLCSINLTVDAGELIAIVGPVGSGKTTLLAAILGEMTTLHGQVHTKGSIAYAPQRPWILQTTLRENILFGKPYDAKRFAQVVWSCGLQPDLAKFPQGDLTEVGERGSTLSGGQRHRVSLARAVYSDAELYLIDDPLGAVDCHVASHIFEEVIGPYGILKNKTRLLVTHSMQVLPSADRVVVMKEGHILENGKYSDLNVKKEAFLQQINNSDTKTNELSNDEAREIISSKLRLRNKTNLIEDEMIEHDKPSLETFTTYGCLCGPKAMVGFLGGLLIRASVLVATSVWVALWSADTRANSASSNGKAAYYMLGGYLALAVLHGAVKAGVLVSLSVGTVQAARTLHEKLLKRILRAKITYFDITPPGRIINWFTRDMDNIDIDVQRELLYLSFCLPGLIAACFLTLVTVPIVLVMSIPLGILLYKFQRANSNYLREVKNLEGVSRSPVFSLFRQTVEGIVSIRAYRREKDFCDMFYRIVDRSTIPTWHLAMAKGLVFSVSLFCCAVYFFGISLSCVFYRHQMDSGVAIVVLFNSLQVLTYMQTLMLHSASLEGSLVAVERVSTKDNLQEEAQWMKDTVHLEQVTEDHLCGRKEDRGEIEFQGYFTKYRSDLAYALKDLTFVIRGKEKIGVVGRTGAGKSTLSLALVRLLEASKGKILMDGVNIAELGLHDLRSKIMVINQEPVLFGGTIRENLDPTNQFHDSDIWNVLEKVFLKDVVLSNGQGKGLLWMCGSEGDELSVGQRQLLCLARALLQKCHILVLDESTAAVDSNTDRLVQFMLRTHLNDRTLITIAHRINTVIDYDRVMVIKNGFIEEFDKPATLLCRSTSKFYKLSKEAGLVQ